MAVCGMMEQIALMNAMNVDRRGLLVKGNVGS